MVIKGARPLSKMYRMHCESPEWQEDKASFGYSPSPLQTTPCPRRSWDPLCGFVDSRNVEPEDTCTGKCLWPSTGNDPSNMSKSCSDVLATESLLDLPLQMNTRGSLTPESTEPNLNWELNQSSATPRPTGNLYGDLPRRVTLSPSLLTSAWCLIGLYEQLLPIILFLDQWNEMCSCFGARLELVNRGVPGMKLAWTLIVKIREPSSGTVTWLNQTLLLMSFVEGSTAPISYGGSIVIPYVWKSKDLRDHYVPPPFGLLPTLTRYCGTQI